MGPERPAESRSQAPPCWVCASSAPSGVGWDVPKFCITLEMVPIQFLCDLFFSVFPVESETVTTMFLQVKIKNGSLNTSLSRNKFLPFHGKTMAILEGTLLFVLGGAITSGGCEDLTLMETHGCVS